MQPLETSSAAVSELMLKVWLTPGLAVLLGWQMWGDPETGPANWYAVRDRLSALLRDSGHGLQISYFKSRQGEKGTMELQEISCVFVLLRWHLSNLRFAGRLHDSDPCETNTTCQG